MSDWSRSELMTVAASRALANDDVCFVGIGAPSAACNLARLTRCPDVTLIYESGTLATRPDVLPLSIGDGELAETALTTVSVPEMFRYWLQGGHISIGFLGAAQVDRFGNINTTVIGDYESPKVRLPGGGGAPEIATQCREVFISVKHRSQRLVNRLDFTTSLGHGPTGQERASFGLATLGPTRMITDLAILTPEDGTNEFVVTDLHPGVTREEVIANTGWPVRFAPNVDVTPAPTREELEVLRDLHARTARAHSHSQGGTNA